MSRGVPGGVRIGPAAGGRRGGAAGRPAGRADGADDPHLRLAHAAAPGQRVHPWLGRSPRGSSSSRWRRSASTRWRDAWRRSPERRSGAERRPDELLARRHRVLGSALESLSYRTPLHLVRGDGAWMEAADGRRYLDAYNNVPVVGHAHPRVVDAIARQAATLNTNTRYLHEHVVELASAWSRRCPTASTRSCSSTPARRRTTSPGAWPRPSPEPMRASPPPGATTASPMPSPTSPPPSGPTASSPRASRPIRAPDTYRGRIRRCGRSRVRGTRRDRRRRWRGWPSAGDVRRRSSSTPPSPSDGIFVPEPAVVARDRRRRARRRRAVRRRRGPVGPRPDGRAVGLRALGRDARHRHPRQADGQRPPDRRRDHPVRDRRSVRRADDVLLDLRRQPGRVRRSAGRPRRARGRAPRRERRCGRRVAALAASRAGRTPRARSATFAAGA